MVADIERLPFSKYLDPPLERMLISSFKLNEINKKLFKKILFWRWGGGGGGGGGGLQKNNLLDKDMRFNREFGKKIQKGGFGKKGVKKKKGHYDP